jgi:hypothetical protein
LAANAVIVFTDHLQDRKKLSFSRTSGKIKDAAGVLASKAEE